MWSLMWAAAVAGECGLPAQQHDLVTISMSSEGDVVSTAVDLLAGDAVAVELWLEVFRWDGTTERSLLTVSTDQESVSLPSHRVDAAEGATVQVVAQIGYDDGRTEHVWSGMTTVWPAGGRPEARWSEEAAIYEEETEGHWILRSPTGGGAR